MGVMIEPTRLHATRAIEAAVGFEDFFRAEHERLFKALFLLTGDLHEADDIAQEALMRAFERWERVGSMDSPAGYVYRTALNLFRSRLRRLAVRARHVFSAAPSDISGAVIASQDVHRALATLPVAQREALILVEWLGLGSEEAGRVLGIEAASVRGRVHRGRDALRGLLGEADD